MKTKVVHHQYHKMESFVFQERNPPDRLHSITVATSSALTPIDAALFGGAAAINMLEHLKTFQEYADLVFIPYVQGHLQHVQRLDIIWDEYVPNSVKATTTGKRGRGIRRRAQFLTTVPKNWKEFLRVDANKKDLFGFLAEQIPPVGDCKQVITNKREQVLCSPIRFDTLPLLHVTTWKQTQEFWSMQQMRPQQETRTSSPVLLTLVLLSSALAWPRSLTLMSCGLPLALLLV